MTTPNPTHSAVATAYRTPFFDGVGYSYGGHSVLCIDGLAIQLGAGVKAATLADQLAKAWNTRADTARLVAIEAIPGLRDVVEGRACIVPRVATDEMCEAAHGITQDDINDDPIGCEAVRAENRSIYHLMLTASPYADPQPKS